MNQLALIEPFAAITGKYKNTTIIHGKLLLLKELQQKWLLLFLPRFTVSSCCVDSARIHFSVPNCCHATTRTVRDVSRG